MAEQSIADESQILEATNGDEDPEETNIETNVSDTFDKEDAIVLATNSAATPTKPKESKRVDIEGDYSDSSDTSDVELDIRISSYEKSTVKWNNLLPKLAKLKATESIDVVKQQTVTLNQSVTTDGKNLSVTSDVEIVETKEEILCISDDDTENPPPDNHIQSTSIPAQGKKRIHAETESPPTQHPPNKKVRRALETMRNQSKITSFFTALTSKKDAANRATPTGSAC